MKKHHQFSPSNTLFFPFPRFRLSLRSPANGNQALNTNLIKEDTLANPSSKVSTQPHSIKLTIHNVPSVSSFALCISVNRRCAVSQSLPATARLISTICCTVSGLSNSSLFKWSNKMLIRLSMSSTCGLNACGATLLMRATSGESRSTIGCAAAGMCERSPRGCLGFEEGVGARSAWGGGGVGCA